MRNRDLPPTYADVAPETTPSYIDAVKGPVPAYTPGDLTANEEHFKAVKASVRVYEAREAIMPATIKRDVENNVECWSFTFDKTVLFKDLQNREDKYIWQAASEFDTGVHATTLELRLANLLSQQIPGATFEVNVTPQFKTFPIPFIKIPIKIPFTDIGWLKSPNKVRGNDELATLPTNVTVKIKGHPAIFSQIKAHTITGALNNLACLHNTNELNAQTGVIDVVADNIAQSYSKNPLKWMAYGLAYLFEAILPQAFLDWVPTSIKSTGRVYSYGYPVAERVLEEPLINSGALALATNVSTYAAVGAVLVYAAAKEMEAGSKTTRSSIGMNLGMMVSDDAPLLGALITDNTREGSFTNGFGHGLRLSNTLSITRDFVTTSANNHAPFATRTLICRK